MAQKNDDFASVTVGEGMSQYNSLGASEFRAEPINDEGAHHHGF